MENLAVIFFEINPKVKVYGFDVQKQNGQERLSGMFYGDVDDLTLKNLKVDHGFNLVVSSSVLYHLIDPLGGYCG